MALPDFDPDAQKNALLNSYNDAQLRYDDYKKAIAQQNANVLIPSDGGYQRAISGIGYGGAGGGGIGIYAGQAASVYMQPSHLSMIAMRMRWSDGMSVPFQLLQTCTLSNGTVKVIVVQNDKLVDIDDDGALFPSDALVAKLRLLADKP